MGRGKRALPTLTLVRDNMGRKETRFRMPRSTGDIGKASDLETRWERCQGVHFCLLISKGRGGRAIGPAD